MSAGSAHIVDSLEAIRRLPLDTVAVKGDGLGDPEVVALTSFRSLKELDLSGCEDVTDYSVSELGRVSSLEKLDLSFCNQVTELSLRMLAHLPALRALNLNFCYSISNCGLAFLGECKSLESVSLLSCEEITDAGVEALARLPNLKVLDLPEFAAITGHALSVLSTKATCLQSLRLDHLCGISDEDLVHLGELKRLRILTIQNCPNVTTEAVAALQAVLPECQITFR